MSGKGDLSIRRNETQENSHKGVFIIYQKDRVGFELGNQWITIISTETNQWFGQVSNIGQHTEFTRDGEHQYSDHFLDKGDFDLKGAAPPIPFWMIELGPQRQKEVLVEQCKNHPLEVQYTGIFGIIPMPTIAWNFLAYLFHQDIIHDQKHHLPSHNLHWLEEVIQSYLGDFLHSPNNVKGGVEFSYQLDEAENIERV
jgi:hypothetical protein